MYPVLHQHRPLYNDAFILFIFEGGQCAHEECSIRVGGGGGALAGGESVNRLL